MENSQRHGTLKFKQESGIPHKDGSKPEKEDTRRKFLQIPEEGNHKDAETIKILTKVVPLQSPMLLQTTPGE